MYVQCGTQITHVYYAWVEVGKNLVYWYSLCLDQVESEQHLSYMVTVMLFTLLEILFYIFVKYYVIVGYQFCVVSHFTWYSYLVQGEWIGYDLIDLGILHGIEKWLFMNFYFHHFAVLISWVVLEVLKHLEEKVSLRYWSSSLTVD